MSATESFVTRFAQNRKILRFTIFCMDLFVDLYVGHGADIMHRRNNNWTCYKYEGLKFATLQAVMEFIKKGRGPNFTEADIETVNSYLVWGAVGLNFANQFTRFNSLIDHCKFFTSNILYWGQGWHILRIKFKKSSPLDKIGFNWRKLDKSGEKWRKLNSCILGGHWGQIFMWIYFRYIVRPFSAWDQVLKVPNVT